MQKYYNQPINRTLSLAKDLIAIPTIEGNHKEINEALPLATKELKNFTIEKFNSHGCPSVLVYNADKRPKVFKVILNGHLDVIPGKKNQYIPKLQGNKLYGVGALDMKANLACLIEVFKESANLVNYPLGLQIVTDEEIGGFNGTKYQLEKGVSSEFVVSGEATNFNIVSKAKGVLLLKVLAKGKAAHGAYPWRGKNSIMEMAKFLRRLEKSFPIPRREAWITTVNVSNIKTSNRAVNKIPDDCEATLDIRYIPQDEQRIIEDIKRLIPDNFELTIISKESPLNTDEKNYFVLQLKRATEKIIKRRVRFSSAHGTSDARHFAQIGTAGIEFGAIGGNIGEDREWIDVASLKDYQNILKDFLLSIS